VLGKDPEVLEQLLELHAVPHPRILDTTYGLGVMWRGIEDRWKPVRMDLDPERGLDFIGNFLDMGLAHYARRGNSGAPTWFPELYDVVIWDPPHITDAGKNSTMRSLYGLGSPGLRANNISHFYAPFLEQAKLVLKENGVILSKLADQVHSARHQWQQVDFINAVRIAGMTPCDMIVKADPRAGTLMGNWRTVRHTRNAHCYWIVVRNGTRCQRTVSHDNPRLHNIVYKP
jgi:hypothetical protein